jgi:hypothetical protein
MACAVCGCVSPGGGAAHAIAAALREDDLDAALEAGLLDPALDCADCSVACRALRDDARLRREVALAARERHRARAARLERRQQERAERRKPAPAPGAAGTAAPALPAAAAAALARAKAKAAARGTP